MSAHYRRTHGLIKNEGRTNLIHQSHVLHLPVLLNNGLSVNDTPECICHQSLRNVFFSKPCNGKCQKHFSFLLLLVFDLPCWRCKSCKRIPTVPGVPVYDLSMPGEEMRQHTTGPYCPSLVNSDCVMFVLKIHRWR